MYRITNFSFNEASLVYLSFEYIKDQIEQKIRSPRVLRKELVFTAPFGIFCDSQH